MPVITPTGTRTLLPKTHTPVSTTRWPIPWGAACRSTRPMVPSLATTLKPARSCPSTYPLSGAYDQILSVVTLLLSCSGAARVPAVRCVRAHSTKYPSVARAFGDGPLTSGGLGSGPCTSFTFLPVHFQARAGMVVLDAFRHAPAGRRRTFEADRLEPQKGMKTVTRPRILVVGAGFAGVECVRRLERKLSPDEADVTLVTPFAYQLYLPLLPQVASGVLTPQSIAVSLRRSKKYRTRIIPGGAIGVDLKSKVCVIRTITDEIVNEPYDYIVLAPGSVTRTFDIPGLTDHAFGMKSLAEAAYVRDHVISQLDLADASQDEAERTSRLQFVVVGGGYAGTETAACLQKLTHAAVKRYPRLDPALIKWHLIDIAPKLMPELGDKLGSSAQEVLRKRGIDISLGVSIAKAGPEEVTFTDGRVVPTRTLIWTAGVVASPLIATLGAETVRGRLAVAAEMNLPGHDGVFALHTTAREYQFLCAKKIIIYRACIKRFAIFYCYRYIIFGTSL